MFVCGVIDWKGKFTTNSNVATWDIRAWNWAGVPHIKQEKDGLKGNKDRVALVGHDLQAFCEIWINMLNNHGVVVVAWENVAIDVQEVKGFTANTKSTVQQNP